MNFPKNIGEKKWELQKGEKDKYKFLKTKKN